MLSVGFVGEEDNDPLLDAEISIDFFGEDGDGLLEDVVLSLNFVYELLDSLWSVNRNIALTRFFISSVASVRCSLLSEKTVETCTTGFVGDAGDDPIGDSRSPTGIAGDGCDVCSEAAGLSVDFESELVESLWPVSRNIALMRFLISSATSGFCFLMSERTLGTRALGFVGDPVDDPV